MSQDLEAHALADLCLGASTLPTNVNNISQLPAYEEENKSPFDGNDYGPDVEVKFRTVE